ncbi:hypothetical protein AVEN_18225-1 [Araneus ventricosus]|uniref:Uncharacterized protein n=1 Tax=Araneus ventricosus TaxID=182803 RepID=A0A4Y2AIK0_ARAVE|nr:hypothetical protein AVEN_18225-1 [Araneus ventricosus]
MNDSAATTINRALCRPHYSSSYEQLMRRPLRQSYDPSSLGVTRPTPYEERTLKAVSLNVEEQECRSLSSRGRGGLVVRPRLWGQRAPGSRPDSTDDPPCMGPVAR